MGGFNWRDYYPAEWGSDEPAHPDAPASGMGAGFFDIPHGEGWEHSRVPHPDSWAARLMSPIDLFFIDLDERVEAVERAIKRALRDAPAAISDATGEELHAILEGVLPSLLLFMCVLGATSVLGAGVGMAFGALAGGIGAPAFTVLGATMGLEAGAALLDIWGLAFLATEIGKSMGEAVALATRGVLLAWHSVEHPEWQESHVDEAAQRFTEALVRVLHGVLQGLTVFLLAKGTAAAGARATDLVVRLRASRLGAGFARWVEGRWPRLIENPRLLPKSEMDGLSSGGGGSRPDAVAPRSDRASAPGSRSESAKSARSQEADFETMYGKAPAAKEELDATADGIAAAHGGTVAKAPIKSRIRAKEKIANDYKGDPTRIKDLARNTIVVRSERIAGVSDELAARGATVKRVDGDVDPLGYSGTNATLVTKSGLVGEIQVNSPEMIYAKEPEPVARNILGDDAYDAIAAKTGLPGGQGHALYEQWRQLPTSDRQTDAIAKQSRAYYDAIRSSEDATK